MRKLKTSNLFWEQPINKIILQLIKFVKFHKPGLRIRKNPIA